MDIHTATEQAYKNGYADALGGGWVSVKDDTPKNSLARVQVFLANAYITNVIGFPKIDTDRYTDGKWERWGKYVTHWMPLPLPPKGEQK